MKKVCIFLVLAMMLSMVACAAPSADPDPTNATEAVTEAIVEGLSITGLSYPAKGSLEEFKVEGVIEAPAGLVEMQYEVKIASTALDSMISDDSGSYTFGENVTTANMADLSDFIVVRFQSILDIYATVADVLDAEDVVEIALDCTFVDANGKTLNITIHYMITE